SLPVTNAAWTRGCHRVEAGAGAEERSAVRNKSAAGFMGAKCKLGPLMAEPYFSASLFSFLRDLKRHNTREWFAANKARYVEHVEAPMLRFIAAVGEQLPSISSAYVADPRRSGGSLYRIYRNTRFSADKTPYKTHTAAHFRHRAASKTQETPGFYLHLSPNDNFAGGGIYHPEMPTLTRIRQRIVAEPRDWARVRKTVKEIEGD